MTSVERKAAQRNRTSQEIAWFALAVSILLAVRLAMRFLSFKQISKSIGLRIVKSGEKNVWPDKPSFGFPSEPVRRASKYVPGNHSCLAKALTGLILCKLSRKNVELRLGVELNQHKLSRAHAWLYDKGSIPIGYAEANRFNEVARYK